MIDHAFEQLRANLEPSETFRALIQQHHNAVRGAIENVLGELDTKLIGSLQRRTRIRPRPGHTFDIDILVVLGEFHSWLSHGGVTAQMALDHVRRVVMSTDRYGAMGPAVDAPTVQFEYRDDVKVELVPAYRDYVGMSPEGVRHQPVGRGYWIPKNGRWELADYDHDAECVTAANAQADGWFIPAVKMLKALRRLYLDRLPSFQVEVLAVHYLPRVIAALVAARVLSYPHIITGFFNAVDAAATGPLRMPGSNSAPVVLTPAEAGPVATSVGELRRYCSSVLTLAPQDQHDAWRRLFGDEFPARP
jgi:hypothetical protein